MPFDSTGWPPPSPPQRVPSGRGAVLAFAVAWMAACCGAGALVLLLAR